MKKPVFLLGICLLLSLVLAGIASAGDACTWGSPLAHWNLTLNGNDCSATAKHLTSVGAPIFSTNGTTFTGNGNYLTDTTEFAFGTNSFSACINVSMSAYDGFYVCNTDSSADSGWGMSSLLGTAKLRINLAIPTALYVYSTTSAPLGRFYEVCLVRNSTDFAMYVDGRFNNTADPAGKDATPTSGSFRIGMSQWDAEFYGTVRDATIYNYALSSRNVSDRYNKIWVEEVPPTPNIDTINISAPQPLNNTQFNALTLNFNLTANASQTFNCSFYTDAMLNQTQTGHSAGSNIFINFNMTFGATAERSYNYYINCTTNDTSKKTENATFFIDNVYPVISSNIANNNTYWTKFLNLLINATDTNLYSFKINDSCGYNYFNATLTSPYHYNLSAINLTNCNLGQQHTNLTVCDGHTANDIGFWNVRTQGDIFYFDNVAIYAEDRAIIKNNYVKTKDRYSFEFQSISSSTVKSFIVESNEYIDILNGKTKYAGHLITGTKWIDFEMPDIKEVKAERINNKKVRIIVTLNKATDKWNFNSIGSLNCVTQTYLWHNMGELNVSAIFALNISVHIQNFSIYSGGILQGSTTTGNYSLSNLTSGNKNISITAGGYTSNWAIININSSYRNYAFMLYKSNSLSINILDETTGGQITENVSIRFTYPYGEWINITNTSTFYIDNLNTSVYQLTFSSVSYAQRSYVITVSNNSYQTLNAYLLINTSSEVLFTIYDKDIFTAIIPDVLITMYKNVNGSWQTVESKTTDITGKTIFKYMPYTNYKFYLSKNGYTDYVFYLNPILFGSYDLFMEKTTIGNISYDFDKIAVIYAPTSFNNLALTNFTFLIQSPFGALINYGFNLSSPFGSSAASGTNAIGGQLLGSVDLTTGAVIGDTIILTYYYTTSISGTRTFIERFPINFLEINNTMISNKDRTYGLGLFERIMIITLVILFIVGIGALIGHPLESMALGIVTWGFMAYIGFAPLWSVVISMIIGIFFLMWKTGG